MATLLADLAQKHNLAVMVTNHVTTQIVNGQSRIVPALGESWAHAVTNRLFISQQQEQPPPPDGDSMDSHDHSALAVGTVRKCFLIKSPHKPNGDAYFQVLECGIRDVPIIEQNRNKSNENESSAAKRVRTTF